MTQDDDTKIQPDFFQFTGQIGTYDIADFKHAFWRLSCGVSDADRTKLENQGFRLL